MKRAAPLFSKKFLRNAAIVLVIAVVAYVVMYGVKEGFQAAGDSLVEYMDITTNTEASSNGIIVEVPSGKTKLTGVEFHTWMKDKWVKQTSLSNQAASVWELSTIAHRPKTTCAADKLKMPKGEINNIQQIKDCDIMASKNVKVSGKMMRENKLDSLKNFVYIKYPGKAFVYDWNKNSTTTTSGINAESIGKNANLAIKYMFA